MADLHDYELLKNEAPLDERTPAPRRWVAAAIGVVIAALVIHFIDGRRPAPASIRTSSSAATAVAATS